MSLLSTFRPLGGVVKYTGQVIRSFAGVVLAKCIFEDSSIACSTPGAEVVNVSGSCNVSTYSVIDDSGNDYGYAPAVTANLKGTLSSLGFSQSVSGNTAQDAGFETCFVSLTGTVPNVTLGVSTVSASVAFTSDQTDACLVSMGTFGGQYSAALPNCLDVTFQESGEAWSVQLSAPAATKAALSLTGGYSSGSGLTMALGCDPSFNGGGAFGTGGTTHAWTGPFSTSFVNALIAQYSAYANLNNFFSGSLVIGGASAAPTGTIRSSDISAGGSDGGWQVGDTFTVPGSASGAVVGTVSAVDGDGNPTVTSAITDPADFPAAEWAGAFQKVAGSGTGTYFGTVDTGNNDLISLVGGGVTVTTN